MKKKPIIAACAVLVAAAAFTGVLFAGRSWRKKQYATEMISAAKSCSRITGEILQTEDEEHPLLADGIYSASYSPSDKKMVYRTADGKDAAETAADFSDRKLYFMLQIKDGSVVQVSSCRKDGVLTEENLLTRQEHAPYFDMSLSEFWLDRFIGYDPNSAP